MDEPSMPADWDDHASWDSYYESALALEEEKPDRRYGGHQYLAFAASKAQHRVWFPGCGAATAPLVYARYGCSVVATDVSATAIDHLNQRRGLELEELIGDVASFESEHELEGPAEPGSFAAFVHDFRQPLEGYTFDLILNLRSFQCLRPSSMTVAARSFNSALVDGGFALFELQNVQGEQRNQVERALLDASFFIPGYGSSRWLRDQLDATGILYVMVLGQPRVPAWNEYANDPELRQRDQARLREFMPEYWQRVEAEQEEIETKANDDVTKIAHLVLNTG